MPLLRNAIDRWVNRHKPDWYRDLPPTFNWKKGHGDFRRGDFRTGFKKYSRASEYIDTKMLTSEHLRQTGIALSLFGGLGDSIQSLRFAKMLSESGVSVTLVLGEKYRPLEELLRCQLYITSVGEAAPNGIPHINLRSVPYLLDLDLASIPTEEYIVVPQERVRHYAQIVGKDPMLKVGVQFTSAKKNDGADLMNRDLDIALFNALPLQRLSLYSLERDAIVETKGVPLIEIGERRSIVDAAAIMKNMDLIITPATIMSNLAGAIHAPVWTLLPHPCPSWRYYLDETRMPWYPTMRLFRQSPGGDWHDVFAQVAAAIENEIASA